MLGGKGSLYNMFTDFPYITPPPLFKLYFTASMGYHVGSLLNQTFAKKKQKDHLEMMFHHLVTFYLYAFSYMTNTLIGPVVALIHDLSDILVNWTRIWSETDYSKVCGFSFIATLILWFYTRLFILPYCIYVSTFKLEVYAYSPYV